MIDDYFITKELENKNGYTWTLTSRLGQALKEAEALFGPRDKTWTILGVEFNDENRPQVWFPDNDKCIIIQLSRCALESTGRALFQLSHEVIHCLSPIGKAHVTVLEEGLATFYSMWYPNKNGYEKFYPEVSNYKTLYNLLISY